ncbi:hypothetical protein AVDCRST_MAG84-1239 [uncultured Microcoleus sp.]|uniref:Uncharacterized protein n=1 Tax=uncultured Microcoleus sp. TaxID=259945 RepID=A0A6J4KZU8_9CYAN|nr:hypothetical protein AVDCRST_MAG84-1239 [uncultured Microcoleus sp.]
MTLFIWAEVFFMIGPFYWVCEGFFLTNRRERRGRRVREEYRGEKRDVKKNICDCYNCKLGVGNSRIISKLYK